MRLFSGGILLPFQKGEAAKLPVEDMPVTESLRIPLFAAEGREGDLPVFPEEQRFCAGDVLYEESAEELPIFATVSGHVEGTVVLNHPQYGSLLCAQLKPDMTGEETRLSVTEDTGLTTEVLLGICREAGIYDELDGIPLWEKLKAWQLPFQDESAKSMTLVADGTENDIFGSSAWGVLEESPREVLTGLRLAAKTIHFTNYHIATMLPKAQRRALKRTLGQAKVYVVGDEYPVTKFSPDNKQVFRIGVQACLAFARAVKEGQKALGITVTVAGDGVPRSRRVRVPYGVGIDRILRYCHAYDNVQVVLGDAMSGVACPDMRLPLLPGTTTLLVQKVRPRSVPQPCIGCGRCAAVCHAELLPYEIVRRLENMHYERLQHLSPLDCDGCGACSYVCPAGRDVTAEVLRAGETGATMLLQWGDDNND